MINLKAFAFTTLWHDIMSTGKPSMCAYGSIKTPVNI